MCGDEQEHSTLHNSHCKCQLNRPLSSAVCVLCFVGDPQEQQLNHEDSQFAASPFEYLNTLQQRHLAASARVEARKRRRLGQAGAHELEGLAAGNEGSAQQQLVGFKGRRRDETHRLV
jgi:hypothetical protein